MKLTEEEQDAAVDTLMRLRTYVWAIKEAEHGSPERPLPSATAISTYLTWGATAIRRDHRPWWRRILPLIFLIFIACSVPTAPSLSFIEVMLDPQTYEGHADLTFIGNGVILGSRNLAVGDTARFEVEPGTYRIVVRFEHDPTIAWPAATSPTPARLTLGCGT